VTVVDAHQHFWNPASAEYPWMTDELASIRREFAPADLREPMTAAGVDATILVQTRSSVEETYEFLRIAAETDFVVGVVGWIDLTDPGVRERIAEIREHPNGQFLVGVRHQVHDEPDAEWLLRADVQRGLQAVGDAGLAYDLLVRPRELPAALEAVRRLDMQFVIDHIGKPTIAGTFDETWETRMAPFAGEDHVVCKLSGMLTEADWREWKIADLVPYVERVLTWFGPERVMFGSDWPVCLLAATYVETKQVTEELLTSLPAEAHSSIFEGTAVRIYGL
jgi:L-fuconolactonase